MIDSGLFHVFGTQADRQRYAAALWRACHPGAALHLLAFKDFLPGGEWLNRLVTTLQRALIGIGTHGVSEAELRRTFSQGWTIEALREQSLGTHQFRLARIRRV